MSRYSERSSQELSGQGLAGGSRAAPGVKHLPGDGDSPRPGQGTRPWVRPARPGHQLRGPWQGNRAGDQHPTASQGQGLEAPGRG